MGKTRFNRIKEMLISIKETKGEIVDFSIIGDEFVKKIGCEYRLKKNGLDMMTSMKMIEELPDGRVKIN